MRLALCFLLITLSVVLGDEFLSQLYGLKGRNKMLVCLKPTKDRAERMCPGALLHKKWVGVSAGCIRLHPQARMIALRNTSETITCSDVIHAHSTKDSRGVIAHFYHPWKDLVLLMLDQPYWGLDTHPNSTKWTVYETFSKTGEWKWIQNNIAAFSPKQDIIIDNLIKLHQQMVVTHSPMLACFLAICLPIMLYILVFVYVIYYSGSSKDIKFKKLPYVKTTTHV